MVPDDIIRQLFQPAARTGDLEGCRTARRQHAPLAGRRHDDGYPVIYTLMMVISRRVKQDMRGVIPVAMGRRRASAAAQRDYREATRTGSGR
jgi:hypothetical protein